MTTEQLVREDARNFASRYIENQSIHSKAHEKVLDKMKVALANYYSTANKLYFLDEMGGEINRLFDEHQPKCANPKECAYTPFLKRLMFYVSQEIDLLATK